jgi:hypothetical protein
MDPLLAVGTSAIPFSNLKEQTKVERSYPVYGYASIQPIGILHLTLNPSREPMRSPTPMTVEEMMKAKPRRERRVLPTGDLPIQAGNGMTIDEIERWRRREKETRQMGYIGGPEMVNRLFGWRGIIERQSDLIGECTRQGGGFAPNKKLKKPLDSVLAARLEDAVTQARELVAKLRAGEEPDFSTPSEDDK